MQVAFKQFIYRLLSTCIPILEEENFQWIVSTEITVTVCCAGMFRQEKSDIELQSKVHFLTEGLEEQLNPLFHPCKIL